MARAHPRPPSGQTPQGISLPFINVTIEAIFHERVKGRRSMVIIYRTEAGEIIMQRCAVVSKARRRRTPKGVTVTRLT